MFPNIFSKSNNLFCEVPYTKNPNASLPIPAMFDPAMCPEDDLHVPNQLPFPSTFSRIPSFGFDISLTQNDGTYWGGGFQRKIQLGHSNYWNQSPSKEDREMEERSRKWNEENARMAKTLPPVSGQDKEFLDAFIKKHTNSKEVPD